MEDGPPMPEHQEGGEAMDDSGKGDMGEGHTALINSDICPDMKPGDTLMLKIMAVHEGEYQVEYMPEEKEHEGGEGGEEMPEAASMPTGDSMME